jgi:RNA polymerase sigma factor (sigma-70 family)
MYLVELTNIDQGVQDPEAPSFEDFFRTEEKRLVRALFVVTGDRELAQEASQDAFVSVLERWERVRSLEDPVGYLYRTAINRVRRLHRRATRLRALLPILRPPPRHSLYQIEDRDLVIRALAELSERRRAAVVLAEMLDFSSEMSGRVLGVTPVTARRLASEGRAALRRALEAQNG